MVALVEWRLSFSRFALTTAHSAQWSTQLKAKLAKQRALADEKERRKNLTKYIPDVCRALHSMLSVIAQPDHGGEGDAARSSASVNLKRTAEEEALLQEVRNKRLKEDDLSDKVNTSLAEHAACRGVHACLHCSSAARQLRKYVEQYDQHAALEHVAATGASKARTEVYLSPLNDTLPSMPALHHPCFVFEPVLKAFGSPV